MTEQVISAPPVEPAPPPARRFRVALRRAAKWGLIASVACGIAVSVEAIVRAHLPGADGRLPTALYSRPTAWGRRADPLRPVVIGTPQGGPLEARLPMALEDLPVEVVEAVLAVEDQRFRAHHGLDLFRIAGAMVANLRAGAFAQGGSTITQQLSKNLFLSSARTPVRKAREVAMALALEARYSKNEILEAYLNEIYLGQDGPRAIHGIGAAARYYFGKHAGKLSLGESALLAGMIHAPNRYAPWRHPADARARRDLVLQLMADQQRISPAAMKAAARKGIVAKPHPIATVDARYFRDYVATEAPRSQPKRGGAVYTTLDARLQETATRAVSRGLARLASRGAEAALVALDPRNGDVLAMVGGRDYQRSQFNRAVDAHRQPGSAFKPIVALTALAPARDGTPAYTLASTVEDEPLRVKSGPDLWEPANYDGTFRGTVSVRQAMEHSLNVPFARIGLAVGPARIAETARRLGIASPMRPVPALALGASEVTLLELTRAYGVLATGGTLAPTRAVLAAASAADSAVRVPEARTTQVADPAVSYLVTSALEGVVTEGTGAALNGDRHLDGVAGKTGTSSNWRDAWFVAYSPSIVVGVWVGQDDGRSIGQTGAAAALPIAEEFIDVAASLDGWDDFEVPDGIRRSRAPGAGEWSGFCDDEEYFLEGSEPGDGVCGDIEMPSWNGDHWSIDINREEMEQVRRELERARREVARSLQDLIREQLDRRRRGGNH